MRLKSRMWLVILCIPFAVSTVAFVLALLRIPPFIPFDSGEIHLPKGYSISFISSSTAVMVNSDDEVIIMAQIGGYRVYSDVVVGRVVKHEDSYWKSVPGYFVLDLKTDKLQQGLSKKDFMAELNKYGIKAMPALRTPSGCDEALGYNKPQPLPY